MRCNVLGDIQAPDTIKVLPGDNLTFDWHHDYRNDSDEIIAYSHHGPSTVYISPDPPTENSFVKLWHEGKFEELPFPQPGKWSTTADIRAKYGKIMLECQRIFRLDCGFALIYSHYTLLMRPSYLIRAEMIGFHEGEVSYKQNPRRGAQFYPNCVQIEVVGNGTVSLPEGVSFPGAYKYEDPGIVYDVRHAFQSCITRHDRC